MKCSTRIVWKYPLLLLTGIGIANIGAWIYLIALNLIILDKTGSALAVGVLYVLKPLAAIATNSWSGSVIDRLNKRNLMVFLDGTRGLLIAAIPLVSSLPMIYTIVLIINMFDSIFSPTSMTYMTKLIPMEQRKRYNSLRSLVDSGGFLIGPAIAGFLFIVGTPTLAVFLNAMALLLSALITTFMPNLEIEEDHDLKGSKLSIELVKKDWKSVILFSRQHTYLMMILFLFNSVMAMTAAVDSLEATFSKKVLLLTNSNYGYLVSLAGAGFVIGAVVNTIVSKRIPTSILMGYGFLTVTLGYFIYAFSINFFGAAIGFFVLSFSLAFANTGFHTLYQNSIPVEIMGRIGSVYGLIEATMVITTTVLLGIAAQLVSIRIAVVGGVAIMFIIAVILLVMDHQRSRGKFTQPSLR